MFSNVIDTLFGKHQEPKTKTGVLDQSMLTQLRTHFEKIQHPVELKTSLDDQPKSQEMRLLLEEISSLSDKIQVLHGDEALDRKPSLSVSRPGEAARIRFDGLPLGHELTSLVLAILHTSGHPPKVEEANIARIRSIEKNCHFETYITLSCNNCPDVVQAFNVMAAVNPLIRHTMIDGLMFRSEASRLKIDAVPTVLLNGQPFARGRKTLEEFVNMLLAEAPPETTP